MQDEHLLGLYFSNSAPHAGNITLITSSTAIDITTISTDIAEIGDDDQAKDDEMELADGKTADKMKEVEMADEIGTGTLLTSVSSGIL